MIKNLDLNIKGCINSSPKFNKVNWWNLPDSDITPFVLKEKLPLQKRIYYGTLKKKYTNFLKDINNNPPKILEGEQILLKHHFDIDAKLVLEAIKRNKTSLRCGDVTARWVLLIYANNINKFIEKVGFISKKKKDICRKMMEI